MKILISFLSFILLSMSTQLFAKSFYGYNCTEDCSGHEAGYAWAETNDIHYEGDCIGKSKSFIEGCLAYIEDNENILEFYRFDEDGNILHEEDY